MPSLAPLDIEPDQLGHIELAGFLDDKPVFAGISGQLIVLDGKAEIFELHDGLLAARHDKTGNRVITSGEDGRISGFSHERKIKILAERKGQWIDRLAIGPSGAIAFAAGRKGEILQKDKDEKPFQCERTIEGLAFAPKGMRLAIARYDGVELLWGNTKNPSQFLEWKGAHIDVIFSPDGRYVVSSMQENALHGWRLADNKHMRMTGYPAKVKSLSWSHKGKWLASSGAPAAILWPFGGKDGPMGKAPKELGSMGSVNVVCVACHPREEVVAIGYENGMVLVVRIEDGKEALLKREGKGAISALEWDGEGVRLAYGSEAGEAGIIDITS